METEPADVWATRIATTACLVAFAGVLGLAASLVELLEFRHLPPGQVRYQPPWTWPVFDLSLGLLALAVAGFLAALVVHRH